MNGSTLELIVTMVLLTSFVGGIVGILFAVKRPNLLKNFNRPYDQSGWDNQTGSQYITEVNPATGFPMVGPNLDAGGNEWGRCTHDDD